MRVPTRKEKEKYTQVHTRKILFLFQKEAKNIGKEILADAKYFMKLYN